jgi:putative ABC transport system permease protein
MMRNSPERSSNSPPDGDDSHRAYLLRYLRFWGTNIRTDVDDEIAFHLERLVGYYVSCGIEPEEARRLATLRFGDRDRIARTMRTLANQRETAMRRTEWVNALTRDVRYAVRQLAKRPAFTAVALLTLALGIGANTAIFSAVNAVLLHPVATHDLDRLMVVQTNLPSLNLMNDPVGPGQALDLMARTDLFDASGSWAGRSAVLTEMGDPRRLAVTGTLGRFFDVFGTVPFLGRFYRPDESENGQDHIVVLSYALWQELGADRSLVDKSLVLNGDRFKVVGVAPPAFDYPRGTQLYRPFPLTPTYKQNRSQLIWNVVGRIKTGLSPEQFTAGIRTEQQRWQDNPNYGNSTQFLSVVPLTTLIAGQLRPVLLVLLGAVGFVLLIACANIASLQLVHGNARTRELAVRAALGANRGVIVRQVLIENIVLSAGGGVLGVATGALILRLMSIAGAAQLPALADVHLDGAVLGFSAAATMVAGLLFGVVPAMRAARVDLQDALREGTRSMSLGAGRNRVLQAGIIVQVALTLVLLLGSGLMIRSLRELLAQNPGFTAEHVATARITATGPRYNGKGLLTPLYEDLLNRLAAVPGFGPVGLISELPFSGNNDSSPFMIRGRAPDPSMPAMHANLHTVGGDYFKAMSIPLLKGRLFDKTDAPTPDQSRWVAIIDETLARTYFPNEDPIGKQINQGSDATIVGVVATVSQGELGEPPKSTVYYPYTQHDFYSNMYVVTRSSLPMAKIVPAMRRVVKAIDPNLPLYEPRALDERIDASLAPRRLAMIVLTGLGVLSLGLAIFGLYGVISYAVSQRTTEFGIRMALGAQPSDVRRMVIRQGVLLALAGVAVGVAVALVATQALAALLFGVSSRDPLTFVGAPLVLAAIAVFASYLPARRATRVNPLEALRGG